MEPPNASDISALDYIVYVVGGAVITILGWLGKNRTPDPPTAANVTLSGALMDNRMVDPLMVSIREGTEATKRNTETNERLAVMLERWINLQEQEHQQEKQKAFQEEVVETALAKLRKEMELAPAQMPATRKRPPERS